MRISDLVYAIKHDIGDAMEADEDDEIDPVLMIAVNGILTEVDEIAVNLKEITFRPRTL